MSDAPTTFEPKDFVRKESLISLAFVFPPKVEIQQLKKWLADALELLPEESQEADFVGGELAAEVGEYLTACMRVACLVSQLRRIPVFDPPEIRKFALMEGEQNKYAVEAVFKKFRAIPGDLFLLAVKFSFEICQFMATNPDTLENRTAVFRKIQEQVALTAVNGGNSTLPVLKVAHTLGIPIEHLGGGVYQVGWGSKARRLGRSSSGKDSAIGARLSNDKVATAVMLRSSGMPVPVHVAVKSVDRALSFADRIGFPLVVKPADRDRGEGVTVDVTSEDQLRTAFNSAQKLSESKRVILEKQVEGVCHRLFIANDRLLYAVKRWPMGVHGDGQHTIAQLVDREVQLQASRPPWVRSKIKPLDEMAEQALAQAGFSSESVPGEGVLAPLRRIESTQWGGIDEEVTGQVHPDNEVVARRAARVFGLQVAGVDRLCSDISTPWHECDAIINEVNYAPLFGGGEISRRAIPAFFETFIDGNGMIPVELFNSDQVTEAKNRQRELSRQGVRCYFTSGTETLDPGGEKLWINGSSAQDRTWALLLMQDTDAVVVLMDRPR